METVELVEVVMVMVQEGESDTRLQYLSLESQRSVRKAGRVCPSLGGNPPIASPLEEGKARHRPPALVLAPFLPELEVAED